MSTSFSPESGFHKIGFLVDNLCQSQLCYSVISKSNEAIQKDPGLNISLFVFEQMSKCILPKFAIFDAQRIRGFDGHLFATCPNTLSDLSKCTRGKLYFYVHDIIPVLKNLDFCKNQLILLGDRVRVFADNEDYRTTLRHQGVQVEDRVINDFDIKTIMEITNA